MPSSDPNEVVDLNVGRVQLLDIERDHIVNAYYRQAVREHFDGTFTFGIFTKRALVQYATDTA